MLACHSNSYRALYPKINFYIDIINIRKRKWFWYSRYYTLNNDILFKCLFTLLSYILYRFFAPPTEVSKKPATLKFRNFHNFSFKIATFIEYNFLDIDVYIWYYVVRDIYKNRRVKLTRSTGEMRVDNFLSVGIQIDEHSQNELARSTCVALRTLFKRNTSNYLRTSRLYSTS